MKFDIEKLSMVRLVNVNPRTEEHGDALVPAVDVKVEYETSSAVLDEFHPELRGALYWANEAAQAQDAVEGVEPISGNLIFPDLDALRWKAKPATLYRFAIELPGLVPVILSSCKVNTFTLEAKEGGTVVVTLRVQCAPVGEREVGKLATMIGAKVLATLRPQEDEPDSSDPTFNEGGGGEGTLDQATTLAAWPFPPAEIPESAKPITRKGHRRTNELEREAEEREREAMGHQRAIDESSQADSVGH